MADEYKDHVNKILAQDSQSVDPFANGVGTPEAKTRFERLVTVYKTAYPTAEADMNIAKVQNMVARGLKANPEQTIGAIMASDTLRNLYINLR